METIVYSVQKDDHNDDRPITYISFKWLIFIIHKCKNLVFQPFQLSPPFHCLFSCCFLGDMFYWILTCRLLPLSRSSATKQIYPPHPPNFFFIKTLQIHCMSKDHFIRNNNINMVLFHGGRYLGSFSKIKTYKWSQLDNLNLSVKINLNKESLQVYIFLTFLLYNGFIGQDWFFSSCN
jgi:hypothetical protein